VLATGQGPAKERHKRSTRPQYGPDARVVETLVGRLSPPKTSSKHHSYFEFVENKDKKKKKLEYKVSSDHRSGLGRSSLFSLGHQQQGAAAWFHVRTRRQPQVNGCLQRAVSREGCHDLHRIGMYILRRLFSHETNRC
jgi:hypothetical protein